jgi:hypothetical protein
MTLPDYYQDNLLPDEVLRNLEKHETKESALLITVDRTPSYDSVYQVDQFRKTFPSSTTIYFEPKEPSTPLDLIRPINEIKLLQKLGDAHQRFIEAVLGKSAPGTTNVIFDTPVSTIAWHLYAKTIGSRFSERDISTSINFQKALIEQYAPKMEKSDSIHVIQRVTFDQILKNMSSVGHTERILLNERVQIFNSCLTTASRITSKIIGKPFEVI